MDGATPAPSHDDEPIVTCPRCGAAESELEGCVACWFGSATVTAGARVGGYRLITRLGEGGSGIVYLARELASERRVALKLAKPGAEHAQLVFSRELKNASKLAHPHIVRVLAGGNTEDGQAFLALELMENGTLSEAVDAGRFRERGEAVRLMIKLTRALEHAHRYFVLHCDLKPENVLFDADGEPHLADFGLAQSTNDAADSELETCGGSWGWMSPEQARRKAEAGSAELEPLTAASDVFSLGLLLHWLLTRELPFGNGPDFERRVQVEAAPPLVPRRRWLSDLDWELSVICQRAMEKDPASRYRSAAELADDLERAQAGLPICAERAMPGRRLAKWVRRHKPLALASLVLGCLLLYLPLVPVLALEQSRSVLVEQNSNGALYQAGAVMNELRAFADDLTRMAAQDDVRALIDHRDLSDVPVALSSHAAGDVENFVVFSADGVLRARWPRAANISPSFDFSFRDYLRGGLRLGHEGLRQVYVARAVRSKISNQMVLELTLPMFDDDGRFIGVFGGSRRVRSTFGAVQMNCGGSGNCMTGLLGPRDRDSAEQPLPSAISVAAAPGLKPGHEITWDLALGRRICAELGCTPAPRDQFVARPNIRPFVADFVDPISHIPSLGAFAPVGRTGLVVVVATPHSAVRQLTDRMLGKATSLLGVPVLLALLLFLGLLGSLQLARPKPTRQFA